MQPLVRCSEDERDTTPITGSPQGAPSCLWGRKVTLSGLQGSAHLNGAPCMYIAFDVVTQRHSVAFGDGSAGRTLKVRRESLRFADADLQQLGPDPLVGATEVWITGVVKRPELNGRCGKVVSYRAT